MCQGLKHTAKSCSACTTFSPESTNWNDFGIPHLPCTRMLDLHRRTSKNHFLNGGTPKGMVYTGKELFKWMMWGYRHFRKTLQILTQWQPLSDCSSAGSALQILFESMMNIWCFVPEQLHQLGFIFSSTSTNLAGEFLSWPQRVTNPSSSVEKPFEVYWFQTCHNILPDSTWKGIGFSPQIRPWVKSWILRNEHPNVSCFIPSLPRRIAPCSFQSLISTYHLAIQPKGIIIWSHPHPYSNPTPSPTTLNW